MVKTLSPWIALFVAPLAIAAACGPSQSPGNVPPQPSDEPGMLPTAPPTGTPVASASTAPSATTVTPPPVEPKAPPSIAVSSSQLLAEVAKLGIDLKKVSSLEKMKSGDKKKLMPLFQKALGFKECTGCHAPGKSKDEPIDVKVQTHNVKLARGMFNNFVVKLRDGRGEAIFCDTCHTGPAGGLGHLLERADKDALDEFMKANYEGKLSRADKAEHNCGSCHGDPFEKSVFGKMWKVD